MLVGSAEYSIPVIRNTLRLAAFVDAGYVEESAAGLLGGWSDLRVSTGLGLRLHVPGLGGVPISLDLATALKRQPEDETRSFHLSVGATHTF